MSNDKFEFSRNFLAQVVKNATHQVEEHMSSLISMTPTGAKRDKYTEANLRLMQAQQAMREAEVIDVETKSHE